jgi:hypothetical protein
MSYSQSDQHFIDSLYSQNFIHTNFDNDINSAKLDSRINLDLDLGKFNLSLKNIYISNVSKLDRNFFRDFDHMRFLTLYKFNEKVNAGIGAQSRILSDDRSFETNKNTNNFFFTNLVYKVFDDVLIDTKVGLRNEDQIGEVNNGPSGIMEVFANNLNIENYISNGRLTLFYEELSAKRNNNFELDANIYKRFSEESDNLGFIKIFSRRNDFFFPASSGMKNLFNITNNVESRNEDYLYAGDFLNYNLSNSLFITIGGNYLHKNISREYKYKPPSSIILFENIYDSKILENNLEIISKLNAVMKNIFATVKLSYIERSETHSLINTEGINASQLNELQRAERNKNNNSRRNSLDADIFYYFSNSNLFTFQSSSSILYYDTDSELNSDDRDELQLVYSLSHIYDNLVNFSLKTTFDLNLSKLHYLSSQRSANNYSNRVYKLTSTSYFKPVKNLFTKNTFQVLANYTVFDFEDIVSQVQSFIYRQMSFRDTTIYNITEKLSFDFYSEVKLYEQGQYNDRDFSLRPVNFFIDQFYFGEFGYLLNDFIKLSAGYKFFEQRRFEYEHNERVLKSKFNTSGVLGKLSLFINQNSLISIIGGVDFLRYDNSSLNSSAGNLQMMVQWNM